MIQEIEIKAADLIENFQELRSEYNFQPLMNSIGEIVKRSIYKNFRDQGRPQSWIPLTISTIRERKRLGYWPGLILIRRGWAGGLLSKIKFIALEDRVKIFADVDYSSALHKVRPFMLLQKEDETSIKAAITSYIEAL